MDSITLTTTRPCFEAVLNGSKRIEYRNYTEYHADRLMKRETIDTVKLHYRRAPKLWVKLDRVTLERRSDHVKHFVTDFIKTPWIFCLYLGDVVKHVTE